jgi:4'-phosphopantetheinyl transferase
MVVRIIEIEPWRMFSASLSHPHSVARLAPGDIHLWCADLNRAVPSLGMLAGTLSADELARASRFRFENDRTHFILRRGILRMCLGNYLDVAPSLLRFAYGRHGKPALDDTLGKGNVSFNLSHSNGIALYAFTRDGEIGVDIEQVHASDDLESLAARFFSPTEYQALAALPDTKKQEAFFSLWTCKEAYVKARGQGLALDLDQFTVSVTPGQAKLLSVVGDPAEASRWSFYEFSPVHGYVATVAIEAHGCHLACRRWMHWTWMQTTTSRHAACCAK